MGWEKKYNRGKEKQIFLERKEGENQGPVNGKGGGGGGQKCRVNTQKKRDG